MVSGPGQNASMSSFAEAGMSEAMPSRARLEPMSTGGAMSRPRPFAASSALTAVWLNASQPMP